MDWVASLDKLAVLITPEEEAKARQLAVNTGSLSHLRDLHNHVADLMLKHRLATRQQLQNSFPEYCSGGQKDLWQVASSGKKLFLGTDDLLTEPPDGDQAPLDSCCLPTSQPPSPKEPAKSRKRKAAEIDIADAHNGDSQDTHNRPTLSAPSQSGVGRPKKAAKKVYGQRKKGRHTLASYPTILALWHPTRNGRLRPEKCKHASNRRVWLRCHGCPQCGEVHEWEAHIHALTMHGGDVVCGSCTRTGIKKLCKCRSVAGDEQLAFEWHEENPAPHEVPRDCRDKAHLWRCRNTACEHVWKATPLSRIRGKGCPECLQRDFDRAEAD